MDKPYFLEITFLLLVCSSGSIGCNSILNIEEPVDGVLDGGAGGSGDLTGGGGSSGGIVDDAGAVADVTLWPDWPMPNPSSTGLPNAQAYKEVAPGVVSDEVTHLEWQADVDGQTRSWPEALTYCESLDLNGGGFRLPTRIELLSLVDFSGKTPSIDTRFFLNTPSSYFWTSSTFVGNRSIAWLVNFGQGPGFVSSSDLINPYPVRCVR